MVEIRPLAAEDAPALLKLAAREDVLAFGDHERDLPRAAWVRWIGPSDPNAGPTLGAFERGALVAALRVALSAHRRRMHGAHCMVLAGDDDAPLRELLLAALPACDTWYAVQRVELRCAADHPRARGLFAELGFTEEARLVRSLAGIDGSLGDEVLLARVKDGSSDESTEAPTPPRGAGAVSGILLRQARATDAFQLAETMSEPSVVWGTLQLPHQRVDRWVERLAANDPSRIVFIVAEVDGRIAGGGALTLHEEKRRSHEVKLGMHVSERFQGRGVGRALMDELLMRAEHQLAVTRIALAVYPDNQRAIRLYESAGFVREGRCRRASFRDGTHVDDVLMARVT